MLTRTRDAVAVAFLAFLSGAGAAKSLMYAYLSAPPQESLRTISGSLVYAGRLCSRLRGGNYLAPVTNCWTHLSLQTADGRVHLFQSELPAVAWLPTTLHPGDRLMVQVDPIAPGSPDLQFWELHRGGDILLRYIDVVAQLRAFRRPAAIGGYMLSAITLFVLLVGIAAWSKHAPLDDRA